MKKFNKRTYKSITDFIKDIKFLFKNRKTIKLINNGELISKTFQERLMLAVTGVNNCRYCTYYHTRLALEAGIQSNELTKILEGTVDNSPEEEQLALLYAQHWADQKGNPDQDFKAELINSYGEKKAEIIEIAIKTINFGNLSGNTFDYFLYKITFGLLGNS
ncbi:MAG: carboxymuconolactone decarboxylase family protein [Halanaerobiales bacterium]|nr:carboxymuconolactone decarboxylase family protein [Halanaerobiales bacterium]